MPRIFYVDPAELEKIEPIEVTPTDPALREAVDQVARGLA